MIIHVLFGFNQISSFWEKSFVHFSIWSYVKTLYCGSGHLGISIKNEHKHFRASYKEHSYHVKTPSHMWFLRSLFVFFFYINQSEIKIALTAMLKFWKKQKSQLKYKTIQETFTSFHRKGLKCEKPNCIPVPQLVQNYENNSIT